VIQRDGKIIAGGLAGVDSYGGPSKLDFALVRYRVNGSLDKTFGKKGIVRTSMTTATDLVTGLHLTRRGSIIATGTANENGVNGDEFALARYFGARPKPRRGAFVASAPR